MTQVYRVLLVEDHPILRDGVGRLLNDERDLHVCGAVASAAEGLRAAAELSPDIVLVDLSLRGSSGLELIKDLRRHHPKLPALAVSMHDEEIYAERVLRAGGRGYVCKHEATDRLLEAIRHVLAGNVYVRPAVAERLLGRLTRPASAAAAVDALSDRELEVFQLTGRGLTTAEIAQRLHRSVKTIESHKARIKAKLGLRGAAQLVQQAVRFVAETEG